MSRLVVGRRGVVQGLGVAAVIAALGPSFSQMAAAAPPLTGQDLEALRSRWVDALTGRELINASPGAFDDAIDALDTAVTNRLALISPTSAQYFSDHNWTTQATDIKNSDAMRRNYVELQKFAVAWATPGSAYEGDSSLLTTIKQGLSHVNTNIYNDQTVWFGNWWSWIIGAAQPLSDILAILQAELTQTEIDTYFDAMHHFVPNGDPELQIHPDGVQESEGANRVDICQAIIIRSIVKPDTTLLAAAVDALSPTWQYVTEGNGFFEDGSFIQHSTIGYTGSYGLVLLGGLSKVFALLADTLYDIDDPTRTNLTSAVEGSFAPLMFNGQMMDAVRGRAVSRYAVRSIDAGNDLIDATLRLAQAADSTTATRWRGLCRQWIDGNSAATIYDTNNITRLALLAELDAANVSTVADQGGARAFPAMDRLVHRGASNNWAVCVAMCSNRISWSEGTAAENYRGAKTSQGMTYLYLADDDDHFDDEFWATFDLEAPPGATVDLTTLPNNPNGTWGGNTPANEWTGSAQLGELGLAGMHLVGPGTTGLRARKSWFTFPDKVVALGSDVSTQSSAEVKTVVEHRNLGTSRRTLTVDGTQRTTAVNISNASWAHLHGVGGYVFLGGAPSLKAVVEQRSGTWQRNNTNTASGTGVTQQRYYATLAYSHGVGSAAAGSGYAYVMLPQATSQATSAAAASPTVTVLRNDATGQGIEEGTVTGANFWVSGMVGDFTANGPTCMIPNTSGAGIELAVSDPTQQRSSGTLTIANITATQIVGDDASRASFTQSGSNVVVTINFSGTAGKTLNFTVET